jgi:hypothetical protein
LLRGLSDDKVGDPLLSQVHSKEIQKTTPGVRQTAIENGFVAERALLPILSRRTGKEILLAGKR